jgi:hypothetical protein
MSAAADHTDQPDRARLRVAAQAAQNKRAALFNAETILALLDTLDRAEEDRDRKDELGQAMTVGLGRAADERDEALATLDALRTDLEALADEWERKAGPGLVTDDLRALLDRTADNHDTGSSG